MKARCKFAHVASIISTDEAEKLIEDGVIYIDVRTEEEFADGHIPGAVNIPVQFRTDRGPVPNQRFVDIVAANFDQQQQLILGCKAGSRSANAAQLLDAAGFENVMDMTAGFDGKKDPFGRVIAGWQQEGREIEHDAEPDRTYAGMKRLANIE